MADKLKQCEVCIVSFIGLPGSGKTTLCKALVKFLNNLSHSVVHYAIPVCYDELIPEDVFRYPDDSSQWKNARREVLEIVKELIHALRGVEKCSSRTELLKVIPQEQLIQIIECKKFKTVFIIIDDNMYYRSMRYEYYQLARSFNLSFCQLYIECSVYESVSRNAVRDTAVPVEIIARMAKKLEPPDKQNSWEKFSFTVPSTDWSPAKIREIYSFLNVARQHPVEAAENNLEEREESRVICSASVMHQVDIALRKLVGEKIKEISFTNINKEELKLQSRNLAECRHSVLERIKMGDIAIPKEISENIEFHQTVAKDQLSTFLRNLF